MDNSLLIAPDKGPHRRAIEVYYDGTELTMEASGEVDTGVSGITFVQLPVKIGQSGLLAFELRGWNNGVTQSDGQKHFHCTERFTLDLRTFYHASVIIFDGNNPDGSEVFIEDTDIWRHDLSSDIIEAMAKDKSDHKLPRDKYPKFSRAEPVLMTLDRGKSVFFRMDSLKTTPLEQGIASISYDRTFLELQPALRRYVMFEWLLTALQTGSTTVLTTSYDRKTNTLKVIPYILDIKNDPGNTGHPSHCYSLQSPPSTWLDFIDFGYSLIKIDSPTAQILEVRATPFTKVERPKHALDLCKLTIICHVPENGRLPAWTIVIHSTGRMTWGGTKSPVFNWAGSEVIPWKHPIEMDILKSYRIICKSDLARFGWNIQSCTLRQPSGPDITQPYYIYTLGDFHVVGVGIKDKTVRSFGTGNFTLVHTEHMRRPIRSASAKVEAPQLPRYDRQQRIEEHMKKGCLQPSPQISPEPEMLLPEALEAAEKDGKQRDSSRALRSKTTTGRVEKASLKKQGKKKNYTWMGE